MKIRLHGGGFMFYSISPLNSNVYVLLGRESKSHEWSCFSGVAKKFESADQVCAREATEELMAINVLKPDSQFLRKKELLDKIQSGPSELSKIEIYMEPIKDASKVPRKLHQTLIHQIPWQQHIEKRFWKLRQKLLILQKYSRAYAVKVEALPSFMRHYCPGYDKHVAQDLRGYIMYQDYLELFVVCNDREKRKVIYRMFHDGLYEAFLGHYMLINFMEKNKRLVETHPAITVLYNCHSGVPIDVRINETYLEKDKIAWWSIPMLKTAIKNSGHYKDQKFRRCFLPTLHIFVNNFTNIDQP